MEFEWDDSKDRSNYDKHGIRFAEAGSIFEGPVLTWEDRRRDYGESRYISVGEIGDSVVVVLVVVHNPCDRKTRIISARKANLHERKSYYAHLKKKT
ncbi:MAG: BrnT family toxin [Candidatus Latescibacteria bacterium]|nr:BrnT family toxin [Candidatus Latescibacterota bacterium]